MFMKIHRFLSLVLLLISVLLIGWASLPNRHQSVTQSISPSEMQLPSIGQGSLASLMEMRQVLLEWPSSMRIGEKEEITLTFQPVDTGAPSPKQQQESSNIYQNYNIMAEARFEVAGIMVSPPNPTRESMPAGQTVKYKWQISTDHTGFYDGTVWLSLRFLPLDGSQASQVPIFIHEIRIHTSSLLGMNETMAYFAGGSGIILGVVIIIGDMIGWIRRWKRKIVTKYTRGT